MANAPGLPPLIPREVIFGNPEKAAAQISPDGRRLTYIAPLDGVLNVWLRTLGAEDDRPLTRDDDRGIAGHVWAPDSRHVLFVQDQGGNENWRIYGADVETGAIRDYTPFDGVQARILKLHRDHPDEILILMNKDNVRLHDVYRLELATGKLTLAVRNPGDFGSWLADDDLQVRLASQVTPDAGSELLLRAPDGGGWRPIARWEFDDATLSGPVKITHDGRSLYLDDARGSNTVRLVKMDLATGAIEVVAEDPEVDVGHALFHPLSGEIQAVEFEHERQRHVVLDETIRADFAALARLHKGDFYLISRDDADRIWVVVYLVDDGPASYFIYDRGSGQGRLLFVSRPDLARYRLAAREPIRYRSRDGLTIHGYLTCPPGLPRRDLPLVLLVHGGPIHRDTWPYDPEAQWLASRGYACLQVNFRGSSGYGKAFVNAGNREWGGRMHDDLVDAVEWAAGEGIADRGRLAIMGGSYGGYAALVGATFTPDLFRCAIAEVGPSNLVTFLKALPPYWRTAEAQIYKRWGDPEKDAEFLRSRSPIHRVDQIRIPLLIAHGANDPRVPQDESEQIVAALKARGIEHEYLLFPDEGHGLAKPENRLRLYAAAERFLARHLGGRTEEA